VPAIPRQQVICQQVIYAEDGCDGNMSCIGRSFLGQQVFCDEVFRHLRHIRTLNIQQGKMIQQRQTPALLPGRQRRPRRARVDS
jgi:hypothetical protein